VVPSVLKNAEGLKSKTPGGVMSSNRRVWLCVVLLVLLASFTVSHGALLGFRQALPGYKLTFPADHASHPDYRTEWWYYTGHLRTPTGKRYGYQLTFFRHRVDSSGPALNPSKWFADNVYLAHMAITDETAKRFVYGGLAGRTARYSAAPGRRDSRL
jgi:predicted secreted hydrolase